MAATTTTQQPKQRLYWDAAQPKNIETSEKLKNTAFSGARIMKPAAHGAIKCNYNLGTKNPSYLHTHKIQFFFYYVEKLWNQRVQIWLCQIRTKNFH